MSDFGCWIKSASPWAGVRVVERPAHCLSMATVGWAEGLRWVGWGGMRAAGERRVRAPVTPSLILPA